MSDLFVESSPGGPCQNCHQSRDEHWWVCLRCGYHIARAAGSQVFDCKCLLSDGLSLLCAVDAPRERAPQPFEPRTFRDVEAEHLLAMLRHFGWNISAAARGLGVDRRTAYRLMGRYSISKPSPAPSENEEGSLQP